MGLGRSRFQERLGHGNEKIVLHQHSLTRPLSNKKTLHVMKHGVAPPFWPRATPAPTEGWTCRTSGRTLHQADQAFRRMKSELEVMHLDLPQI